MVMHDVRSFYSTAFASTHTFPDACRKSTECCHAGGLVRDRQPIFEAPLSCSGTQRFCGNGTQLAECWPHRMKAGASFERFLRRLPQRFRGSWFLTSTFSHRRPKMATPQTVIGSTIDRAGFIECPAKS